LIQRVVVYAAVRVENVIHWREAWCNLIVNPGERDKKMRRRRRRRRKKWRRRKGTC